MSKKNYTMSLEVETVNKIKTEASDQDRTVSWLTNMILKNGIDDTLEEKKWLEIAHGYEYENIFLRKELNKYRSAIDEFCVGFMDFKGDYTIEEIRVLTLTMFKSLQAIEREV